MKNALLLSGIISLSTVLFVLFTVPVVDCTKIKDSKWQDLCIQNHNQTADFIIYGIIYGIVSLMLWLGLTVKPTEKTRSLST